MIDHTLTIGAHYAWVSWTDGTRADAVAILPGATASAAGRCLACAVADLPRDVPWPTACERLRTALVSAHLASDFDLLLTEDIAPA